MAFSEKGINDAIQKTVENMWFGSEKDLMSVTNVRAKVEKQLGFEDGFLKTVPSWDAIKRTIKTEATKYIDAEEAGKPIPPPKLEPSSSPIASRPPKKLNKPEPAKKGTKRTSNGEKTPPKKRQKKAATPSDDEESESPLSVAESITEESELSDFSDAPKPKKAKKPVAAKPPPKRPQKVKIDSEDKEGVKKAGSDSHIKVVVPKRKESKKQVSDEDSELSDLKDEESDNDARAGLDGNDSDSDMSVLIDEGPKPKKSRRSGSKDKTSKPKSSSSAKSKPPAELSPDEAELKTLQSHLLKCGIRKIWGIELKKYGDDMKGKIRHLKGLLREAGMDGRFSEAKAREIKEARELKADLEAVMEGEKQWGMGRGERSKKTKPREHPVESGSEEDDEEDDAPPPRVPRAKMDLAFLGDESESE